MAFTEDGSEGTLNGTTEVTLVAAPGSGKRIVRGIRIVNLDTADVVLTVARKVSGTNRVIVDAMTLAPGDVLEVLTDSQVEVLGTTKSIVAFLAGAITTTNPDYTTSYADRT